MIYCPRCGAELDIYEEQKGYLLASGQWLYRMYPCSHCKIVWDWASKIRYQAPEENYWKLEECRAWEAVGILILQEQSELLGEKG